MRPLPTTVPNLSPMPFPSLFSLALSESEQRLSQIQELIDSMPKPNHDTLWYLLEHLRRSGGLNIWVHAGGVGSGACSRDSLFKWVEGRGTPKFRAECENRQPLCREHVTGGKAL